MNVDVKIESYDDVALLSIEGHFDASMVHIVSEKILGIIESVSTKIIFDCTNLSYISSAGLRIFLYAAKKMREKKGQLALCCVNSSIQRILDISGLSELLPSYKDRESALLNI